MVNCVAGAGSRAVTSRYAYGSDGLRRRMTSVFANGNPAVTTDDAFDGQNVVQERVGGSVAATYLMGPSGPLYRRPVNASGVRWYVYDGGGNVAGEVDVTGNVMSSKKHDVYGLTRGSTGTSTSKHGWQGGVGHQGDGVSGLVYTRARFCAPELGRFQSEDTARDGINWFAYFGGDPDDKIDPTGKAEWNLGDGWVIRLGNKTSDGNAPQFRL